MSQADNINQTNGMSLPETLLQMISGVWVTQAIYVAAKLGVADLLKDSAKSSEELAESTGVDEQSLYRVLRALASVGIFAEGSNRHFELTPLAQYLRTDTPGSMRAIAILKNCHRAMVDDGKLLLVENVLPSGNEPSPGKFLDLEMLLMTSGGCERTESEFQDLFAASGFKLTKITPKCPLSVIEGIKA